MPEVKRKRFRAKYAAGVFYWTGKDILAVRRRPGSRFALGLPAGHEEAIDYGSPEATARRELLEETGLFAPCLQYALTVPPEVAGIPFFVFVPCAAPFGTSAKGEREGDVRWSSLHRFCAKVSPVWQSNHYIVWHLLQIPPPTAHDL